MVVIDIETGPLPLEQIQAILPPFDPNSIGRHPGEFDPATVKYGHIKDEAKKEAKLEESRKKHADLVAAYEKKQETGESDHWREVLDQAALNAITGQVLAIGVLGKQAVILSQADRTEEEILTTFWKSYVDFQKSQRKMVGFNLRGFDVPFLYQRSVILNVDTPDDIFEKDRYLGKGFIDLRDRWLGCSSGKSGGLGEICRACGVGEKPDGISGGDFHKLFWNESTRSQAFAYLLNDLQITRSLAIRLGINMPPLAEAQAA